MKRNEFLKYGLIGGMGLIVLPMRSIPLMIKDESMEILTLPSPSKQVRHGEYSNVGRIDLLKQNVMAIERIRYYANGFASNGNDLFETRISLGLDHLQVVEIENVFSICLSDGERFQVEGGEKVVVSGKSFSFGINEYPAINPSYLLCLGEGEFSIQGNRISKPSFIQVKRNNVNALECKGSWLFIGVD